MARSPQPSPPETCPICGCAVPRTARACPECGADHQTGWNEEATRYDGIDLPGEEFDYDEFVKDEFSGGGNRPKGKRQWIWICLALLLLLAFLFSFVANW